MKKITFEVTDKIYDILRQRHRDIRNLLDLKYTFEDYISECITDECKLIMDEQKLWEVRDKKK